tara:strand:- start:1852 stop:3678 length:1827 start_codon:yes stop_codon:yes gene_type:complete
MNIQKKNLTYLLSIIFSIFITSYCWELIELPFKKTDIIGEYSSNQHSAYNDIFRYIFFIFLPVLIFLILQIFYKQFLFEEFFDQLNIKENIELVDKNNFLKLIKIFIVFFIFLEFLSIDFDINKLDLHHEGQRLSSAFKSSIDGSLWSGSYVIIGIFHETLSSKLIWELFNHQSIGLIRFADRIYILLCKLLIILIIFRIADFSKLKKIYKESFIIITSLIVTVYLYDYHTKIADVEYLSFRELPVLLISYLFFEIIAKKNSNKLFIVLLGSVSLLSMMWSIDRGIVCNILLGLIAFYFFFTKRNKNLYILFFSIFASWLFTILLIADEFDYFLNNTLLIFNEINYIHGIIHPSPFSIEPQSFRATKIMLAVILCLIISISFFSKKENFSNQFKLSMLFIAITSFLTYGYALGRSDGIHLKQVFGYSILFITIFIIYKFTKVVQDGKIKFINSDKISKFLLFFLTLIIFVPSLNINTQKIIKFKGRFIEYIYLNDGYFLSENIKINLNKVKKVVKNEECIQLFDNDLAYLYLLKKKNCTKYYNAWSVGSTFLQNQLINDLKNTRIIFSSNYNNKTHPTYKLPIASDFINNNYSKIFEYNNKIILSKIN